MTKKTSVSLFQMSFAALPDKAKWNMVETVEDLDCSEAKSEAIARRNPSASGEALQSWSTHGQCP